MKNRVVITGMGVCTPLGNNLQDFSRALDVGKSGITHHSTLKNLNFSCQVAGQPDLNSIELLNYFSSVELRGLNSSGLVYGALAGLEAYKDAGLQFNPSSPNWDLGVVFGTGILGVDKFREAIHKVDDGLVRRLGSGVVEQTMSSGISAFLGGKIGAGNQVTTNSSACSTGTEAILMGYELIANGQANKVLVGSCSDGGPYVWGAFDAMRILPRKFNEEPEKASRPMSATAAGFVPGCGSGALFLESLESALGRGAKIYAEVLGGAINSGGQRNGGSMTAPNPEGVQHCIANALSNSGINASQIDAINGHLTATSKDAEEIRNWSMVLGRDGEDFPKINSFKGHLGHCLAAAGSIECVGAVLQIKNDRLFGNKNCEDVHPDILNQISSKSIPQESENYSINHLAKASFGFGDVNACVIFGRHSD
ncbi:beta-ketoacyl-[acyl-carrier-protein] synthase family protein [Croceivirga thetidis]|uniref:3-oxoacyl-[acyl-carrier-protein] synthase 1 n=1 Tax=Croceivirga thetidis TaxID=2721623 RepID=A0ABX1GR16_9FLAO|nr:beta-ketoacyl-[acyl-carrier-protein] synthase family protein [Croceivirga thetidis]NKI32364.1 beta-ketoacyl-[acyl-carrier-protein] synthase family protein [Croceivirga thetidis]